MIRLHATAVVVVLLWCTAACQPPKQDRDSLRNENANLSGTIRALEKDNEKLAVERNDLEQSNKKLKARVDMAGDSEAAVVQAKEEISAHVKEMEKRFLSDSDIDVERTKDGYRFVLREAVLFDSGSAALSKAGQAVLLRVANALRDSQHKISIEGHTDDTPLAQAATKKKYPRGNIELSVGRALSVWEYLAKNGKIESSRISVAGFGKHRPLAPNDSDHNRWRNRRVEIRVAEK